MNFGRESSNDTQHVLISFLEWPNLANVSNATVVLEFRDLNEVGRGRIRNAMLNPDTALYPTLQVTSQF